MVAGAARLLAQQGLQATSFSEVLEYTESPRGSLYHHFPEGKGQLVKAALDLVTAQMSQAFRRDKAPLPSRSRICSCGGDLQSLAYAARRVVCHRRRRARGCSSVHNSIVAWPDGPAGAPAWLTNARPMHWIGALFSISALPVQWTRDATLVDDYDGIEFVRHVDAESSTEIGKNRAP